MELYEINYKILHGAVQDKLLECTWSSMRLITRLYMELYKINY